jgi:hypothetical protein
MKKKIIFFAILIILILLAPRLFIVSMAVRDYFGTTKTCSSQPSYIFSVKPFTVITDRGTLYPGDEYVMTGEGAWYGMTTLIFVGSNGAYFYDVRPVDDPVKGQLRIGCRLFVPIGDY